MNPIKLRLTVYITDSSDTCCKTVIVTDDFSFITTDVYPMRTLLPGFKKTVDWRYTCGVCMKTRVGRNWSLTVQLQMIFSK